jgi:hypothetical protein
MIRPNPSRPEVSDLRVRRRRHHPSAGEGNRNSADGQHHDQSGSAACGRHWRGGRISSHLTSGCDGPHALAPFGDGS